MAKRRKLSNLLALSLLSLLAQRRMYPYEMAQTLRARGKDQNFKVNWGSLCTVVQNLEKYGLIEAVATERAGRQPERTTYQITAGGRAELRDWLSELLSSPDDERGGFATALSEAGILPPDEVTALLGARLAALEKANERHQADLSHWAERLPRVLLIESEYALAMRRAQADWLRGIIGELTAGTIGGMDAWRQLHATEHVGGHGDDRGDRAGYLQPLPGHPGQPPGDYERLGRGAGRQHHRADSDHRRAGLGGRG